MATIKQRNAAFDAVKAKIPAVYAHFIDDAKILEVVDAALFAAENTK